MVKISDGLLRSIGSSHHPPASSFEQVNGGKVALNSSVMFVDAVLQCTIDWVELSVPFADACKFTWCCIF